MNMTHSAHDTVAHDLTARQEGFETQWQIACGVHSSASQDICDTHGHLACGTNLPAAISGMKPRARPRRDSTSGCGLRSTEAQCLDAATGSIFPQPSAKRYPFNGRCGDSTSVEPIWIRCPPASRSADSTCHTSHQPDDTQDTPAGVAPNFPSSHRRVDIQRIGAWREPSSGEPSSARCPTPHCLPVQLPEAKVHTKPN